MIEFSHQRNGTGTREWAEINVNIQQGCSNNCKYCYARANALRFGKIQTYDQWQQETIDMAAVNKRWTKRNGVIMFPTTHDITMANLDPAIVALRNMLSVGNNVLVVSKPRMGCVLAICKELQEFRNQILFRFTIGSIEWKICDFWEPGAPEPHDRIAALEYAFDQGFKTSVSMEPMLGGADMAIKTYHAVEPFVVDAIWVGKMNRMRSRVDISVRENIAAVETLELMQRDSEILRLVDVLGKERKIRWKDSIQTVIKKHASELSAAAI